MVSPGEEIIRMEPRVSASQICTLSFPILFRLKNRVLYKNLCLHDLLSPWYRGVSVGGSLHTAVS